MLSDMPKAKNKKDLSDYIVQCEELENRIIISRKRAIERFSEVQRQIELLEDENEKTVLTLRYLRNYNWEKICEWVMYSWKQVHRIHLKALQNFELKKRHRMTYLPCVIVYHVNKDRKTIRNTQERRRQRWQNAAKSYAGPSRPPAGIGASPNKKA